MSQRDGAAEQLTEWKEKSKPTKFTTGWGAPVPSMTSTLTVGKRGIMCVQDTIFFDTFSHFNRENIPERIVHAKGAGASGYFECTEDISKYTKAVVFKVGKKTDVAVRFSTTNGESGYNETSRESRGFAMKFYTEDGNWDLTMLNIPIFFIRDAMIFPSLNHVAKRNPVTHLKDADALWDFISLRPELIHSFMRLYAPTGIPDGYRHINGYAQNVFKLVNAKNESVWCKFVLKTDQGVKGIDSARAVEIAGTDPDYATRDLYNAIHGGNYPSWTFYIQVMTLEQAKNLTWNAFDSTREWPKEKFPLIKVGKVVLNQNPSNYFSDVEQIAFNPGALIPGIEPSPDRILQARILTYSDAARYRLGANHLQLPINCPFKSSKVCPSGVGNDQRDGFMAYCNQNGAPSYYPNSFNGPQIDPTAKTLPFVAGDGLVDRYDVGDEDNFSEAALYWKNELQADEKKQLVDNIANSLKLAQNFIQAKVIDLFKKVDKSFGEQVENTIKEHVVRKVTRGMLW